jgi:structural maintenance of chromosome 1
MDAISFVLGIQSKHLRSTQLKDLIFRQNLDSKSARKAEVKLFYSYRDDDNDTTDKTIIFSRSVISSGSTSYKINGSEVPFDQYDSSLSSIGVLVKARNFLVFQGDIESVAQKSPIEFTKLIEQISG